LKQRRDRQDAPVLDHRTFVDALDGRDARLRDQVGPDAIGCVAPELGKVCVVQLPQHPAPARHTRPLLESPRTDLAMKGAEIIQTGEAIVDMGGEDEPDEDGSFAGMVPTSLVVYLSGDFAVHYEQMSGTEFYMDGYWAAVRFRADRTPVDHSVEA
jgi:hypothetical protein